MQLRSLLLAIAAAALAATASVAQQDAATPAPSSGAPALPDFSVAPADHSAGTPRKRKPRKPKVPPATQAVQEALPLPGAPAAAVPSIAAKPALATESAPLIQAAALQPLPAGARAPSTFQQSKPALRAERAPGFGDEDSPFFAALRIGLLVPAGKPEGAVSSGVEFPNAHRAGTVPASLQLGYRLPWLSRKLAITGEAGWYPLSAHGDRSLPQDPDYGHLQYRWSAVQIPLLLGVQYALPFKLFGRVGFNVSAAATAIWARYTTTYLAENVQDAPQKGWALGAAVGAGATWRLGPGALLFDLRYVDARTDLGLRSSYPTQPYNAKSGDVQGTNFLAGYRLDL